MNQTAFSRKGGQARSAAKTAANRAKAQAFWAAVRSGKRPAPRRVPRTQAAYLHAMLVAARLIHGYLTDVMFGDFRHHSEKRDAVVFRLLVLSESAAKIAKSTEVTLPGVPFKDLRGMRNRIAYDYGAVDFKTVWTVTQTEIEPLLAALEAYFKAAPVLVSAG